MLHKSLNFKKYFILSISLLILITSACGFGTQLPQSNAQPTETEPTETEPTEFPKPTETISSNESPSNTGINISVFSLSMGEIDNGWRPYQVKLAFQNNGEEPILLGSNSGLDSSSGYNFQKVSIDASDSFVETSEGKTYPVEISIGVLLPPHIPITGINGRPFIASYKIPELLHPTHVVISPGILDDGQVNQLSFDISSPPQEFTTNSIFVPESLPSTIQVSDQIQGTINAISTGQVIYNGYPLDKYIMFFIETSLKNADITSDQAVSLRFYAVDMSGMFSSVGGSNEESCTEEYIGESQIQLYSQIGPGQEITQKICLALPEVAAHGKREFYVLVVGDNVFKVYGVKIPNLSNCVAESIPRSIIHITYDIGAFYPANQEYPIEQEYQLGIPGSVSGTLKNLTAHRLDFQGNADATIDIQVLPTSTGWGIILSDPAGYEMFYSNNVYPEEATKLININLLCNGQYKIYLFPFFDRYHHPESGSRDYTVSITVK
jgi:hypothetical protein